MSVKVSGKVWEMDLPPNEKIVLLALADHADHDGNNAYPGERLLAAKTGYDERSVRRFLRSLTLKGIIERVHEGHGPSNTSCYSIKFDSAPVSDNFKPRKQDNLSSFQKGRNRRDVSAKSKKKTGQDVLIKSKKKTGQADLFNEDKPANKTGQAVLFDKEKSSGKTGQVEQEMRTSRAANEDKRRNPPRPPYKEEPSWNRQEPSTHTQKATASPSRVSVSRFDEKVRREYARHLASQKFIRNPDGYAISIADGRVDSMIQEWIDSTSSRAVETRPDPNCDYCEGTGTMRVREDGTAVKFDSAEDTRNVKKCKCRTIASGNGKADPEASDHSNPAMSEREKIKHRRRKRAVDRPSEEKSA